MAVICFLRESYAEHSLGIESLEYRTAYAHRFLGVGIHEHDQFKNDTLKDCCDMILLCMVKFQFRREEAYTSSAAASYTAPNHDKKKGKMPNQMKRTPQFKIQLSVSTDIQHN